MRRFLPIGLVAGLLMCCLMAAGCSRPRPVDEAREKGILLLGNGPEPQSLDPHVTTGTSDLNIQMAVYEGLVAPDPETLEPLPAVAESWEVSDDETVYRFTLRKTARWSDGEPVTAHDFKAGWERALDPLQGTPYAYMLYVLEGGEAFNRSTGPSSGLPGIRVIDAHTLEVSLRQPVPFFLSLLLHPVWFPIPAHLDAQPGERDRTGPWAQPESFVGNGPFTLKEWLPNQTIEVQRNPQYWDNATTRLEGIRFHTIDEPGAEERAFLAGQLHVTDSLPPARVEAYRRSNDPALRIDPYLGTYYILPNTRTGVLADPLVRKALSLSVDRKAIVDHLLGAGQRAAGGFVPDNMPGYESGFTALYDPAQGRTLLAEAGYPDGDGFPVLEYLFNSSESHRKIAEALQAMWKKELNIDIQLTNQEWRTYLQRRSSGDFELARAVWIGDYAEPSTFLDLWTSDSGNNWAGWASSAYDAYMKAAHETGEQARRMERYRKAESVLLEEQGIIPLYHYVTVYLKDPGLKGWSGNLLDWHPVKYLFFED